MRTEDQYIQEQFQRNFIEQWQGNIVIYGIGVHTRLLLESIESDKIKGLMDATKTGEMVYGKKVLSYEEVAAIPNVCIVIIARNSVINVIYRRIQNFVTENNIPVYNVNGKLLLADSVDNASKECFELDIDVLKEKIRRAEVVSFDIFDTLLCRCVLRPTDVFRFIDERGEVSDYVYSTERMRAESELSIKSNYNIDDIYKQFQKNTGEPDQRIEFLKQLEIKTEKNVLRRREDVCSLLEEVYRLGKNVYLISDMYFPEEVIKEILNKNGITSYHRLYVSTTCKTSKAEHLFEFVRDDNKIGFESWLHIGDNQFSDVYAPASLGIDTYKLYSTTEMLEESIYSKILECNHSLEENIVISCFAAEAFNSPFKGFHKNGKLKVFNQKGLARMVVAPLLLKYIVWLTGNLKKAENDLVLFPARDGFILQHIYKEVVSKYSDGELPESVYFYTSRRAMLVSAAKDIGDVRHIIELPDSAGVVERIRKRFNVILEDEYELDEIPQPVWTMLLNSCSTERERYNKYLDEVGFYSNENIAFVDFVAVGTIQEALQRMTGKEVTGYYFLRRRPDSKYTERLKCESMYPISGDFQAEFNIYKFYYFLENIVSSYEPTFKRINSNGEYDFFGEPRTEEAILQLKDFHEAIIEYCKGMLLLYPNIEKMNAGIELYDTLLGFFDSDYMDIEPQILNNIINYDEFLGKKITELNR